jgi:hypothetical protein
MEKMDSVFRVIYGSGSTLEALMKGELIRLMVEFFCSLISEQDLSA